MRIKKSVRVILICFILFAICDCAFLFMLPLALTANVQDYLIKKAVSLATTARIDVAMRPVKTYSDFTITGGAAYIILKDENGNTIFAGHNIDLRASALPLIFKKISVNNFNAQSLQLNIKRFADGEYNIEKIFKNHKKNRFNFSVSKLFCNIEGYDISFVDEYNDKKILITGDYFKINNFVHNKFLDIDTSGMMLTNDQNETPFNIRFASVLPLSFNPDLSKTILEGYFENVSLGYFKPYFQEYIANDINDISADMSFEFYTNKNTEQSSEKQFLIKGTIDNLLFDKTSMQGKMSSDSRINTILSLGYDERKLTVNNLNINSDNFEIKGNGTIKLSENELPDLALNFNLPESNVEDIAKVLPTNIIPKDSEHKDVIKKIKKHDFFGKIKGTMSVVGQIPKPHITGTINARNVKLFSKNEPTHTGIVNLEFKGNTMFLDVDVSTSDGESAQVTGLTYLFNEGINHFNIVSTDNLDLPLAQKIVLPVQDVLRFELGPVPMMDIEKGKGKLDIKVDGTKIEGSLFGRTDFRDGRIKYNGIHGVAEDVIGEITFADKEILYNADGYFAGYQMNINGKSVQNGIVEINIGSNAIETADVVETINNSPMMVEVKRGLSALNNISGMAKIDLTMRGNIEDFQKGDNVKSRGTVYLFNDKCNLIGFDTPLHSAKGIVEFTDREINFKDISAMVENSLVKISGNILINKETKVPNVDIVVTGDEILTGDTIKFLAESNLNRNNLPDISNLYSLDSKHDLLFKYNAESNDFKIQNSYAELNFLKDQDSKSPIKINRGGIIMKNSKVYVDSVIADFFNTKASVDGNVSHIDTSNPIYNLDINIKNFNFASMPEIKDLPIVSDSSKTFISMFEDFKGNADLDIKVNDNNMSGNIDVSQLTFKNKQTNIPILIPKTKFDIKGNKLSAKAISAKVGKTDVFGDVAISEIGKNNIINSHLTTKITKDFVEAYVNPFLPSPAIVTGDIELSTLIKGEFNNLDVIPHITLSPDADIFYLKTNLGDTSSVREFNGTINLTPHKTIVKDFRYIRSKHTLATFNADFSPQDKIPDYITLNTNEALPAKFLNPIFGQDFFKTGDFNANIKYFIDSEDSIPKLQGNIDLKNALTSLDKLKIDIMRLKADKDKIKADVLGNSTDSDIKISAVINNNLNLPINIETLNIFSNSLNNTTLIDTLNSIRTEYLKKEDENKNDKIEISKNIINIHDGTVNIDVLNYQSIKIEDISAKYNLNDANVFEVKDINAKIGEGTLNADASYNIPTGDIQLNTELKNVDSNLIAENLFGAKNQLYGTGHGKIFLETKGMSVEERLKNLNGECWFVIMDGKMPKLGSLEYLLRASNIIKSGISGLTLNNMLDLLNFAKTGNFISINGSFIIENGIAKDINVFSQGNNLSLYMDGKYNILKGTADAEIWGKLSNKLSTLLGPLGNASLNSFFNMIPGISAIEGDTALFKENIDKIPPLEYSNDDYKLFQAIIDGNINNSNDYVKSFKWIE